MVETVYPCPLGSCLEEKLTMMLRKKNGLASVRGVCAVIFILFSFLWLYEFQADVLAVAQHVLSQGQTHYDRTIGAVLITAVLMLLQLCVYAVTRLSRRTHALTYLPSMLVLAVISDVPSDIDYHFSFGAWAWVIPVVLIAWGGVVWLAKHVMPFENDDKTPTGVFSRRMWINLLQMMIMMIVVTVVGNTNAVFHFTAHAETALLRNDAESATRVGIRSEETDECLSMLRIHALARQGQLAEQLFCYPLKGNSADMLPLKGSRSRLRLLPADSIWKAFGARPVYAMTTKFYLSALERDTVEHPMVADYVLCGLLIDRQLDDFAEALPRYYSMEEDSLPRHYREALSLRRLLRHHGSNIAADSVADNVYYNYYKQ